MKRTFTAPEMSIYGFLSENLITTSGTTTAIGVKFTGDAGDLENNYTTASISWGSLTVSI